MAIFIFEPRGVAPRTPFTLYRSPLRRLAPFAWFASLRSLTTSHRVPIHRNAKREEDQARKGLSRPLQQRVHDERGRRQDEKDRHDRIAPHLVGTRNVG